MTVSVRFAVGGMGVRVPFRSKNLARPTHLPTLPLGLEVLRPTYSTG